MRVTTIAGAVILALAGASTASAQTAAEVRAAETRFRAMDTNGDGNITRAEWRGSAQSFRVHDWNNDGVLSGTEIRTAARQAANPDDYAPNNYNYNDWSARGFSTLDDNRDGRISRQEWHYDLETFNRVDRDRNGFLSRAEFTDTTFDDDRGDRFDDLDINGNNRVERSEWHGGLNAFQWLDRNSDGVLTRAEVVGNTATTNDDQFTSLDVNRDRAVSRSEWHWSPGSFTSLDRNGDGRLTRAEYDAAGPLGATGTTAKINVNGFDRWTDTGIFVRNGDELTFDATGKIQFAQHADTAVEWRGAPDGRKSPSAPMPDLPIGHLIVRIGNGAPVAAAGTVHAPRDGRLYLGVNDDIMPDNSGAFQVTVTLRRP